MQLLLTTLALVMTLCCTLSNAEPPGYLTYNEIVAKLNKYVADHPTRTYLYPIGKTVKGRDILVLAIANSQPNAHVPLRAEVKYETNIHGESLATGELILRFIDDLLNNPSNDPRITEILDNSRLHFLVSLQSDTSTLVVKENCTSFFGMNNTNGYDIDSNFPDKFYCQTDPIQPETLAVIEWFESMRFFISARFFIGYGLVTSYPYENFVGWQSATEPRETLTEDDDVFKYLAKKYALNHKVMPYETALCQGKRWTDGITNGAAWWPPVPGSLEDINYWRYGTYEITPEIGCCVLPPASELPKMWDDNRNSLIEFTRVAQTGIRGIVKYQNGKPARFISVQFDQREPIFKTDASGEYYALLLPGTYNMTLRLNCDFIFTTTVRLHASPALLVYNITLDDSIYFRAIYYNLDKYALFCTKSKAPVDCSSGYQRQASVLPNFNLALSSRYIPSSVGLLFAFVVVLVVGSSLDNFLFI